MSPGGSPLATFWRKYLASGSIVLRTCEGGHDSRRGGACDETGFGPIVVAPLFRGGLEITLMADGVMAQNAAERVANPSAVRVPVAAAVPLDPGLADLLSALTAGSFPDDEQLWVQEPAPYNSIVGHARTKKST